MQCLWETHAFFSFWSNTSSWVWSLGMCYSEGFFLFFCLVYSTPILSKTILKLFAHNYAGICIWYNILYPKSGITLPEHLQNQKYTPCVSEPMWHYPFHLTSLHRKDWLGRPSSRSCMCSCCTGKGCHCWAFDICWSDFQKWYPCVELARMGSYNYLGRQWDKSKVVKLSS